MRVATAYKQGNLASHGYKWGMANSVPMGQRDQSKQDM